MLRIYFAPLAALLAVVPTAHAQVLRGGDIVVTNYQNPGVFRIDSAGNVTSLAAAPQLAGPSGIAADFDGSMVICDATANQLVRIDRAGALTTIAPNLATPLRVAVDRDGSYLVTMVGSGGIDRVYPSGAVANFLAGGAGGMRRAFDVMVDGAGDYVVCDDLGNGVYRVTQRGAVTPIHVGSPFRLPQGAALFPNGDYAVFDGLTDSVFRVDRGTGNVTTWVPNALLGGNPCGIVAAGDGGFFVSMSSSTLNQVVRIDAAGNVTPRATGAPFTNLEVCAMVPFVTGVTSLTTGPGLGSIGALDIDVPTTPNSVYMLGMAGSLFPGLTLPGEARAITLTADGLLFATLGQNVPPLLNNWVFGTDAQGRATAGIDMSILPAGLLAGRTLFVQGLVLSPSAQNGIEVLTNFHPLTFQ